MMIIKISQYSALIGRVKISLYYFLVSKTSPSRPDGPTKWIRSYLITINETPPESSEINNTGKIVEQST